MTLLAQQDSLEEIEVNGSKDPSSFTLSNSVVVGIDESGPQSLSPLKSLLENIPGVIANQNGGPAGRVSFFMRGTESRHVSFTIDALKINDVSNNDRQFDAAFLSSPFLRSMTVFKGPQAVLFGSDAMGGLIDMRTRKGESAPETRLNLSAGSFGTASGSLSSDWKKSDHQGTLTYTQAHSDGFSRLNKKRFNAKERDGSDSLQATSSSIHRFGKNQTDLLLSFINGRNELDGMTDDNSHNESRNHQYLLQQKTSHSFSKGTSLSLRNGLNRNQRFTRSLGFFGDQTFTGDLIQNELLLENKSSKYELTGGLSSEHESVKSAALDRAFDLHSLFLQSLMRAGILSLQAGGRLEEHSRYGQFQTGSAGVSMEQNKQKIFLQYSQGFKAPSLYQLHAPVFGDSSLVPERNRSWETGWKYDRANLRTEITFFQNKLSNLITFTSGGFRNQGDYEVRGLDASARWTFAQFALRPGYTYQEFRNTETVILRRPRNSANLQASWFVTEPLELYGKLNWFSARKDLTPDSGTAKLNGFETVDLGANFQDGLNTYSLQVINLLDREYEELYGYSVMPRSVFAGFGRKFSF